MPRMHLDGTLSSIRPQQPVTGQEKSLPSYQRSPTAAVILTTTYLPQYHEQSSRPFLLR